MAEHNIAGSEAEQKVVEYLQKNGYKILNTNWKTKFCEIDIVARKGDTVHFVEVKYRSSPGQGSGYDYVTSKKFKQMARAAEGWVLFHDWNGEYVLSAAEVSGPDFDIEFLEEI